MANPFAKIMAAAKQKADEQQWREERLKQLEDRERFCVLTENAPPETGIYTPLGVSIKIYAPIQ